MFPSDETKNKKRIILIGFDGATLELIRPWVKAGLLPTFGRMMSQSAWGELQSVMPPVTPAAWSTLATGTNLGKHGLFDFFSRKDGSYETYVVNSTHRHGATLWDLLGKAGKRVCVFNVPASYPPDRVNGVMVSGLLTPTGAQDAAWPSEILPKLKEAVPDFSFYPPGIFSEGEEIKFVNDVLAWDEMTFRANEFLMKQDNWDFLFTVFIGVDIASHFMWKHMVSGGSTVPGADAAKKQALANAIQRVYQQADHILDEMLKKADDNTVVMVVSDHGFGPLDNYMHFNAWLEQKGYLKFKRTPFVMAKYMAYKLGLTPLHILNALRALGFGGKVKGAASENRQNLDAMVKRAFLSLSDVDWTRTQAFTTGFGGPIFINLKGREPQGIVAPGAEHEALIQKLKADLSELRHPVTGQLYTGEFYRPDDLYSGPYAKNAPDLMFVPRDWSNQGYGLHDFASNKWLEASTDRSGTHRMNGILFMHGNGIRPGYQVEGASLQDIAPTVLALMGVPIPQGMDGHVISSAMDANLYSQLEIKYREAGDGADDHSSAPVMSEDEELVIRERLEALGYFG